MRGGELARSRCCGVNTLLWNIKVVDFDHLDPGMDGLARFH